MLKRGEKRNRCTEGYLVFLIHSKHTVEHYLTTDHGSRLPISSSRANIVRPKRNWEYNTKIGLRYVRCNRIWFYDRRSWM